VKENAVMTPAEDARAFPVRPVIGETWMYLACALSLSWAMWILLLKVHAREEYLTFGTVGPAFAALILSRRGGLGQAYRPPSRPLTFLLLLVPCWAVIALHVPWSGSQNLTFRPDPWLVALAMAPAWVLSGVSAKDAGVRGLLRRVIHRPSRWSFLALLLFPAMLLVPAFVAHLFNLPLVIPERTRSVPATVGVAMLGFLYNLLFVALLEEPGWRGFLLDRLQRTWSPLSSSVLVWAPWALWHGPLDYYRPVPFSLVTYLQVRVVFLIPIAVLLTWLCNRSGGSIQAAVILHASMNTFPFVLPYFRPGLGLLFAVAAYAVVSDRMWRGRSGQATRGAGGDVHASGGA
jgi:membrane protease YdiL (CAAX protease family)